MVPSIDKDTISAGPTERLPSALARPGEACHGKGRTWEGRGGDVRWAMPVSEGKSRAWHPSRFGDPRPTGKPLPRRTAPPPALSLLTLSLPSTP